MNCEKFETMLSNFKWHTYEKKQRGDRDKNNEKLVKSTPICGKTYKNVFAFEIKSQNALEHIT